MSQDVEQRRFTREEICKAFNVPLELVTVTGNAKAKKAGTKR